MKNGAILGFGSAFVLAGATASAMPPLGRAGNVNLISGCLGTANASVKLGDMTGSGSRPADPLTSAPTNGALVYWPAPFTQRFASHAPPNYCDPLNANKNTSACSASASVQQETFYGNSACQDTQGVAPALVVDFEVTDKTKLPAGRWLLPWVTPLPASMTDKSVYAPSNQFFAYGAPTLGQEDLVLPGECPLPLNPGWDSNVMCKDSDSGKPMTLAALATQRCGQLGSSIVVAWKPAGSTSFTIFAVATAGGSWNGNYCSMVPPQHGGAASGWYLGDGGAKTGTSLVPWASASDFWSSTTSYPPLDAAASGTYRVIANVVSTIPVGNGPNLAWLVRQWPMAATMSTTSTKPAATPVP